MKGNAMSYHFRLLSPTAQNRSVPPTKILYLFKPPGAFGIRKCIRKETGIATADLPMAFVL